MIACHKIARRLLWLLATLALASCEARHLTATLDHPELARAGAFELGVSANDSYPFNAHVAFAPTSQFAITAAYSVEPRGRLASYAGGRVGELGVVSNLSGQPPIPQGSSSRTRIRPNSSSLWALASVALGARERHEDLAKPFGFTNAARGVSSLRYKFYEVSLQPWFSFGERPVEFAWIIKLGYLRAYEYSAYDSTYSSDDTHLLTVTSSNSPRSAFESTLAFAMDVSLNTSTDYRVSLSTEIGASPISSHEFVSDLFFISLGLTFTRF